MKVSQRLMTVEISESVKFSSGLEVNTTICREIIINDELEGNESFGVFLHVTPAGLRNHYIVKLF